MDRLKVGSGPLELRNIIRAMKKKPTSFAVLLGKWVTFGNNLLVKPEQILQLRRKVNIETLQLEEVPFELLKVWKAGKGKDATLKMLHDALLDSGLKDVAESLVEFLKFDVQGRTLTLEELIGENVSDKSVDKVIYEALENSKDISLSEPIQLLKKDVFPPELPEEYSVKRKRLSISKTLNPEIFLDESTNDHIFLIKGIDKNSLARLVKYQPIDTGGRQIHKVTVRFIVLEDDKDFERICQKTIKPVHFIELKDETFMSVRSNKCLGIVRGFLQNEEVILEETEIVKIILASEPTSTFIISESPTNINSSLLASLAKQVHEANQNQNRKTIVLFEIFQEFLRKVDSQIDSSSTASHEIASYSTNNEYERIVVEEALKNGTHLFDLFLYGYDEIPSDMQNEADSFLEHTKSLKNVRIHVSTRPRLKEKLENDLNIFSYCVIK